MKVPNYQNAVVSREKIIRYLLSPTHRDGRHKAAFFAGFGFSIDHWQELATALLRHVANHEVAQEEDSLFGKRYVINGTMRAPDGRTPVVRSVWSIDTGTDIPRFVTAYPLRRQDDD